MSSSKFGQCIEWFASQTQEWSPCSLETQLECSVACRVQIWWAAIFGKGVVAPVIDAFVGRMCPLVVDPEEGRRFL